MSLNPLVAVCLIQTQFPFVPKLSFPFHPELHFLVWGNKALLPWLSEQKEYGHTRKHNMFVTRNWNIILFNSGECQMGMSNLQQTLTSFQKLQSLFPHGLCTVFLSSFGMKTVFQGLKEDILWRRYLWLPLKIAESEPRGLVTVIYFSLERAACLIQWAGFTEA